MESGWEEKKIQALFSELKAADEQTAPRFATTWNRAGIAPERARAFNLAFIAATGLLFCALVSLAVWSKYSQRTSPPSVAVVTPAPIAATGVGTDEIAPPKPVQNIKHSRAVRAVAQRNAALTAVNQKVTRDAKAISSWQSPTATLLSSPSDEIFNSLPQLNQSSSELKSFLPSRRN